MGIAYIAALVQITVLRGGVDWQTVFSTGRAMPQMVPFKTTLEEARLGLWLLIYHTIGNMIWFVPLGSLLRRKRVWQAILAGAALSLGIEIMQFVLRTGMSDIDDIILNAAGAGIGRLAARIMKKHGFK